MIENDTISDITKQWKRKFGMPEGSKETPDIFKNSVWLLQWFYRRIKKNRNAIALFIGDTGSGKSYGAIRLAERVDPGFGADRIVFTVKDFLTLVNADLPKGSVIIFDDAGLGINARLWQEESARIFGMLTQGFRYKQILTFITVPDESFIERQSRKLVHIRFEATDTQGIMKPKLMSRNSFDPDRPLTKYPVIRRGRTPITIKTVKLQLPTQSLAEEYERRKNAYMEKRFKEFQEELETLENGGTLRNGRPTVHLKCDDCGYQWDYSGGRTMARCPNCESRVYIDDGREERDEQVMLRCRHCGYRWEYSGKQKKTACPDCEGYVNTRMDRVEVS